MTKKSGHTRGGSHSRKKWDRIKKRNYYAKELLDPNSPYRTRVHTASDKRRKEKVAYDAED